jgi:hypothetical protein
MFWPWERSAEVLHAWREWTKTAPDEATTAARIMQMPPMEEVPEFLRGRSFVTIDGAVIGDRAHGAEVISALRELGPEIDTFDMVPPVALSRIAVAGPESGSTLLMAEIRHLGGALGRVEAGHGALAKLDADYVLFGGGPAFSPEMVTGLRAALPRFKDAMAEWDAGTGYLNFEESTVDSRSFYDEVTHRRLSRIKAQIDAGDLFRSNHPIEPAR